MRGVNKCTFIGNVGNDPEVRHTTNGTMVANLSIAVNEKWKENGEVKERTEWIRLTAWDKLAEIVSKYVTKGTPLYIEGRMRTTKYTDKEGVDRYTTSIVIDEMVMLGGNRAGSGEGAPAPSREGSKPDAAGDLPF